MWWCCCGCYGCGVVVVFRGIALRQQQMPVKVLVTMQMSLLLLLNRLARVSPTSTSGGGNQISTRCPSCDTLELSLDGMGTFNQPGG